MKGELMKRNEAVIKLAEILNTNVLKDLVKVAEQTNIENGLRNVLNEVAGSGAAEGDNPYKAIVDYVFGPAGDPNVSEDKKTSINLENFHKILEPVHNLYHPEQAGTTEEAAPAAQPVELGKPGETKEDLPASVPGMTPVKKSSAEDKEVPEEKDLDEEEIIIDPLF